MTDNKNNNQDSGVWITLGENDGASNEVPKRADEGIPWVLDPDRMTNWSDIQMYNLEVSFREWLFKAMQSNSWRVPTGKGHWNVGCKMTFDVVQQHFNIEKTDYKLRAKLTKLCKHYCTKVMQCKGGIYIGGKRHSHTGYYFPRTKDKVKPPYSLRLKFETMIEEGKAVTLKQLRLPESDKKTLQEMHATRVLQNKKQSEYYNRWLKKYGGKYDYSGGADSPSDEDTDSRS